MAVKFSLEGFDVVDRFEDHLQLAELGLLLAPPLGQQEPQPLHLPWAQRLGHPDVVQLAQAHRLLDHCHCCC